MPIEGNQAGRSALGASLHSRDVVKAHPSLDKQNRVRTGENQFLEQFCISSDKRQRYGIAMVRAPLYELVDECLVIRQIAEYTVMPRKFEPVVLDRIMVRRYIPRTVHRRTRVQVERSKPTGAAP